MKINKEKYNLHSKYCRNCNIIIPYEKKKNIYCSQKCGAIFSQRNGGHRIWDDKSKQQQSTWAKLHNYKPEKNGILIKCTNCDVDFYVPKSASTRRWCNKKCYVEWVRKTDYMKGKTGGYRKEAGRGKMGWYKGYYCNSSWELAWVIYQLERGIKFKRNTEGFEYIFDGKKSKFYPDFILNNGNYVEIKGWITEKDKAKFLHFPKQLDILFKKSMQPIINSVISKYGKKYWDLYESKINS